MQRQPQHARCAQRDMIAVSIQAGRRAKLAAAQKPAQQSVRGDKENSGAGKGNQGSVKHTPRAAAGQVGKDKGTGLPGPCGNDSPRPMRHSSPSTPRLGIKGTPGLSLLSGMSNSSKQDRSKAHAQVYCWETGGTGIPMSCAHSCAGPKRFDRVSRFRQMQAIWAKDAFLRSGAAGADGSGAQQCLSSIVSCMKSALLSYNQTSFVHHGAMSLSPACSKLSQLWASRKSAETPQLLCRQAKEAGFLQGLRRCACSQ